MAERNDFQGESKLKLNAKKLQDRNRKLISYINHIVSDDDTVDKPQFRKPHNPYGSDISVIFHQKSRNHCQIPSDETSTSFSGQMGKEDMSSCSEFNLEMDILKGNDNENGFDQEEDESVPADLRLKRCRPLLNCHFFSKNDMEMNTTKKGEKFDSDGKENADDKY